MKRKFSSFFNKFETPVAENSFTKASISGTKEAITVTSSPENISPKTDEAEFLFPCRVNHPSFKISAGLFI